MSYKIILHFNDRHRTVRLGDSGYFTSKTVVECFRAYAYVEIYFKFNLQGCTYSSLAIFILIF